MDRGKFIVFEGLDGCGKTTQIDMLHARLAEKIDVVKMANISDSPIGKTIRAITLSNDFKFVNIEQIACLYLAELHHVSDKIRIALEANKTVICSRHILSLLTYAATDEVTMKNILNMCSNMIMPDINIFLYVNIDRIKKTLSEKENADYWEQQSKQEKYLPRYTMAEDILLEQHESPTLILNADESIEAVHERIYGVVCRYLDF